MKKKPHDLTYQQLNDLRTLCPILKLQVKHITEIGLIVSDMLIDNVLFFINRHSSYQFEILTCISGVDFLEKKTRFKVVYELLSLSHNNRLRIKVIISEVKPVESAINVFFCSKWQEAEVWDMFGIFFTNHLNLIRLLTDYGFEGFPGRKKLSTNGFCRITL